MKGWPSSWGGVAEAVSAPAVWRPGLGGHQRCAGRGVWQGSLVASLWQRRSSLGLPSRTHAQVLAALLASPRGPGPLARAGPGKAWSARDQGARLFELVGRRPFFLQVPVALMDGIIAVLDLLARVFPGMEARPAPPDRHPPTWGV